MIDSSLIQEIEQAEWIVVGIGSEWKATNLLPYDSEEVIDFYRSISMKRYEEVCRRAKEDESFAYMRELYYSYYIQTQTVSTYYDVLGDLLKGKNFFVITSNSDDLIYHSTIQKEYIVAPCGTRTYLQCSNQCSHTLYPAPELLLAKIKEFEEDDDRSTIACGNCHAPLEFNIRTKETASRYIEDGYLKQWDKYTNWISKTLHQKLLLLELGEGFEQPSLFHWPFERMTYFNQKAKLIRVHHKLSQVGEEIKERAISIPMSSVEFIKSQKK